MLKDDAGMTQKSHDRVPAKWLIRSEPFMPNIHGFEVAGDVSIVD